MLKILGKASSINVRKVLWTCEEIGLPYQQLEYGSGTSNSLHTEDFLRLNPNAMVPVIEDDGQTLWESNSICRYLANKHQRQDLLPIAAMPRAQIEKWMDWQATELNNSWRYAFMARVRLSAAHQDPVLLAQGEASWNQHMSLLDQQLQVTKAYVNGDTFSLADIVLGLSLNRWKKAPIQHAPLEALDAYFALLCRQPAFLKFSVVV
ncbi:MAG: glutathione S-transferase [Undibacterium sp.]|nr:glutathione S-transferase [Undibacterium sp.]